MTEKLKRSCVFFTHFFHVLYFGLITWRMYHHLEEAGKKPSNAPYAVGISFITVGGLVQIGSILLSCYSIYEEKTIWKWIPGLLFCISSVVQYGMALHLSHANANKSFGSTNSTQYKACSESVALEAVGDNATYFILLTTLPMMVITNILYALTDKDQKLDKTLINAYAALEVIDMAELMFADVGWYQGFGTEWLVCFYLALGITAFLIPFSEYGLEQKEKSEAEKYDVCSTILNLLFNDASFLVLRIITMAKNGKIYIGLLLRSAILWNHHRG